MTGNVEPSRGRMNVTMYQKKNKKAQMDKAQAEPLLKTSAEAKVVVPFRVPFDEEKKEEKGEEEKDEEE